MAESKPSLKERFSELSPGIRIGVVLGTVFFLGLAVLVLKPASTDYKGQRANPNDPLVSANLLSPKVQDRSVEQLNGELTRQARELEKIRDSLDRNQNEQRLVLQRLDEATKTFSLGTGDGGVTQDLIEEMRILRDRVEKMDAQQDLGGAGITTNPLPTVDMSALPVPSETQAPTTLEPPKIVIVGGSDWAKKGNDTKPQERVPYMTASSMFEGQLLNGMDAPTDQSAKQNPVPAVVRVKSEAILPNLFNVPDVQECFVSVAGYGDLSDERAKMRTEMLSCVVPSKTPGAPPRIIEAKVEGYVVGEDGRVGMRGRLVSKQGQLIAKTLLAGVLSGFGDAIKPQSIQGLNLNPTGTVDTQTYDGSTIAKSGLAQGLSDTAKSVSEYYLRLADQMMPIVEVDAGRKVTVVLLKGVELK